MVGIWAELFRRFSLNLSRMHEAEKFQKLTCIKTHCTNKKMGTAANYWQTFSSRKNVMKCWADGCQSIRLMEDSTHDRWLYCKSPHFRTKTSEFRQTSSIVLMSKLNTLVYRKTVAVRNDKCPDSDSQASELEMALRAEFFCGPEPPAP